MGGKNAVDRARPSHYKMSPSHYKTSPSRYKTRKESDVPRARVVEPDVNRRRPAAGRPADSGRQDQGRCPSCESGTGAVPCGGRIGDTGRPADDRRGRCVARAG